MSLFRLLSFSMYTYLESNDDVNLVYGRNCRNNQFSEPNEFSFSIPGQRLRKQLSLSSTDCTVMASWLYTSSELLWGMYRSFLPKIIPSQPSYGADHAL